mmetsp:Transcript_10751/g.22539  ORF Transcript_10751/g.22539 Transcript_10751/m.22539 type:complete len:94 (-) Transcript_10751:182-463(-)
MHGQSMHREPLQTSIGSFTLRKADQGHSGLAPLLMVIQLLWELCLCIKKYEKYERIVDDQTRKFIEISFQLRTTSVQKNEKIPFGSQQAITHN